MRALAILLALPAACQNQPQPAANAQLVNFAQPAAPAPRDEVAVAEQVVRRQLRDPSGLVFSGARVRRDQGIPIVCGQVSRNGRSERYVVIDARGAWLESEVRPGTMDTTFREYCGGRTN